jgi:hypothetical protein
MYNFDSLDHYMDNGKRGFYVKNILECHDFDWLKGETVLLDGVRCKVTEVKRHPHLPPWKVGEEITLMVEHINKL